MGGFNLLSIFANQTIDLQGRRCDQVEDFFFTGPLDYLLFEGELALGSTKPPTVVIKRKPAVSLASVNTGLLLVHCHNTHL